MLLVLTTTPTSEEATALAEGIVAANLAACVQVLPAMTSVYVWEGEIKRESENLLLIKTLSEKYSQLETFIIAHHSYSVPEIVAIKAERVSSEYGKWLVGTLSVGP